MDSEPPVLFKLDFRNAFNCRRRDQVLSTLFSIPTLQAAFRLSHWAYSQPSALFLHDLNGKVAHVLESKTGVRQGCPLGHSLFAISVQPLLQRLLHAFPNIHLVAIADDINVVLSPWQVEPVFDWLQLQAKDLGLDLVPRKCQLAWLHSSVPVPPYLAEFATKKQLPPVEVGATQVLGAIIGDDRPKMRELTTQAINKTEKTFESLRDQRLSTHEASLLLSKCAVEKVGYLWRATLPGVTLEAAEAFDHKVRHTAEAVWEAKFTDEQWTQAQLPIRFGGCGLGNEVCREKFIHN